VYGRRWIHRPRGFGGNILEVCQFWLRQRRGENLKTNREMMCRSDCQGRRGWLWPCVIWGFRREVAENYALTDSGSCGNLLLTFRDNLSVFSSGLRTALFWVVTQRVVVISYRRFGTTSVLSSGFRTALFWVITQSSYGTTYRSHPQGLELRSSGLLHRVVSGQPIDPILRV